MNQVAHSIALNFELPAATESGSLPDWLLLVPAGQFTGRDKRAWINDLPDQAVAFNRAESRDVPFDIEHATEIKAPQGDPAPAVGWVKELDVRQGAIWGRVEWNEDGQALLGGKKYRYYSPAIRHDSNNRVTGLSSVGLTNKANLTQLSALNHQSTETEDDMSVSAAIRQALGLVDTATDADAVLAIGKLKDDHRVALNTQREGLVPKADYDLVVSQLTESQTALNTERAARLDEEINTLIDTAIEQKKIAPASRDYHIATCREKDGIDRFKKFIASAPALLTDTGLDGKKPGEAGVALNSEEGKIAAMFGNSAEDLAKYGK